MAIRYDKKINNEIINKLVPNYKQLTDSKKNKYRNYIRDIELTKPKTKYFITLEDLIGLYNAYKCINYQIELKYNQKFIQ